MYNDLVIVRGGGDLATGTIHRLTRCGFKVAVLEVGQPTVIRRTVAFAQAVFDGEATVEGIQAVRVNTVEEFSEIHKQKKIPILIDPAGESIKALKPQVVVDAIIAKRNLGTSLKMAPVVIGLGPGFTAGLDVHAVIETNRGHNLGRVIYNGSAEPDTGNPGEIGGYGKERIVRSPAAGIVHTKAKIGDIVEKDDIIGYIGEVPVLSPLNGVLRGLIQEGIEVPGNYKIGDVDPRGIVEHCYSISDKARAIAGGVLEAMLHLGQGDRSVVPDLRSNSI
jgi:xanthine dehydrogenase accessory factor